MFRASSLPGKPGRFRASDYLCSSEHTCIGCIAQMPRFRASNYLCSSEHTCIDCIAHIPRFRAVPSSSLLGTLLLCSARNTASLPASVLGTLLPPMLCSEHCLLVCFYALLGTLLLCLLLCSAQNTASLPASIFCS